MLGVSSERKKTIMKNKAIFYALATLLCLLLSFSAWFIFSANTDPEQTRYLSATAARVLYWTWLLSAFAALAFGLVSVLHIRARLFQNRFFLGAAGFISILFTAMLAFVVLVFSFERAELIPEKAGEHEGVTYYQVAPLSDPTYSVTYLKEGDSPLWLEVVDNVPAEADF